MKKIYALFAGFFLLLLLAYYLKQNLIPISSFFLQRSLGIKLSKGEISWRIESSKLLLDLRNVRLSGEVSGIIERMEIKFGFSPESIIRDIRLEKFDLTLKEGKETSLRSLVLGFPRFELKDGILRLDKSSIGVGFLESTVDQAKEVFRLSGKLSIRDIVSESKVELDGTLKKGVSQITGEYQVKNLNLKAISEDILGTVDLRGSIFIKGERLESKGTFSNLNAKIRAGILKKPYAFTDGKGRYELVKEKDLITLKVTLETPSGLNARFTLNLKAGSLDFLRLSTGEIGVLDAIEYLGLGDLERYLSQGKIRVKNLEYSPHSQILCDLELEGFTIFVGGLRFEDIKGPIRVASGVIKLLGIEGIFGRSLIREVRGDLRLKDSFELKVFGKHEFYLPDFENFFSTEEIAFEEGKLIGDFDLVEEGEKRLSYRVSGTVEEGKVLIWGKPYSFSGRLSASEDGIILNPVTIYGYDTELEASGKIGWSGNFSLSLDGKIPTNIMEFFIKGEPHFEGHAKGKLFIEKVKDHLRLEGKMDLFEASISFRDMFLKPRQIPMTVSFGLTKEGSNIYVRDLDLDLPGLRISGYGEYLGSSANFFVKLLSEDIHRFSESVHFKGLPKSGELLCEVTVKDLRFDMGRLPTLKGQLRASVGPWRLGNLEIKELSLYSTFDEEKTTIVLGNLRTSSFDLGYGHITLEGRENPKIEGDIAFRKLEIRDFDLKKNRRLPRIENENLLFRAKASLRLKFEEIFLNSLNLRNLDAVVQKEGESFSSTFEGSFLGAAFMGKTRVSLGKDPEIELYMDLEGIELGDFALFIGRDGLLEGKTSLNFFFISHGGDFKEIMKNPRGNLLFTSSEGRIRRWNLIAKVLHLLNLYDVARIPIDFPKEGLKFKKMVGSFDLKDGHLHTNDFLIESPSLILRGEGKIDLSSFFLDASVSISPFLLLEKTLEKIPILRRIFYSHGPSVFSVHYNVSGSITDPEVRLDFMRTLPKKALSITESLLRYTLSIIERLFRI